MNAIKCEIYKNVILSKKNYKITIQAVQNRMQFGMKTLAEMVEIDYYFSLLNDYKYNYLIQALIRCETSFMYPYLRFDRSQGVGIYNNSYIPLVIMTVCMQESRMSVTIC